MDLSYIVRIVPALLRGAGVTLALFALGNDGVREVRAALRARREKPGPGALNAGQTHKNVLQ